MLMNLFLVACFACVMPIMYAVMRNEVKPKKNIVLGVTLPLHAREDARVQAVCKDYTHTLGWVCFVFTLLPLLLVFTRYTSVIILVMCVWMIPAIVLPMVVYGKANRRLLRLKKENGWFSPLGEKSAVVVDLAAAVKEPFVLKKAQFVLTAALSVAHLLFCLWFFRGKEDLLYILLAAGSLALFVWLSGPMCAFLVRRKAETVGENTELNIALTRVRREGWYHMWLLMAWSMLAIQVLVPVLDTWLGLAVMIVFTAVILVASMAIEFRLRGRQQTLTTQSGSDAYTDEDEYWLYGQFYYNKNDSHVIVNNRVGANTSVNLARPGGAAVMIAAALLILLLPLLGVWTMAEELSPMQCTVTSEELVIKQNGTTYAIAAEDVVRAEVLEELPELKKRMGSNFSALYKGSYEAKGIGRCEVLLDPGDEEFLLIETENKTYLFSFRGELDAAELAEQLQ